MRKLAACALAALIFAGCSSSTRTGYQSPTGRVYELAIVSGDNQSGTAVVQPVTFQIGGPPTQAVKPPASVALPLPLVVEVRDQLGHLVDGVQVIFEDPDPSHGVVGLGTETTGIGVVWNAPTANFPATKGQAATVAQPYRQGTFSVTCRVDTVSGTSNVVTFFVTGT